MQQPVARGLRQAAAAAAAATARGLEAHRSTAGASHVACKK
jgi:hypothetical protein